MVHSPNSGTFKTNESIIRAHSLDVNQGKWNPLWHLPDSRQEDLVLKGKRDREKAGLEADGSVFPLTTAARRKPGLFQFPLLTGDQQHGGGRRRAPRSPAPRQAPRREAATAQVGPH